MEQRSKEWFDARSGRFTASRISDLLGVKGFGKMGDTYAYDCAVETVFGPEEEEEKFISWDIKRGVELEPLAFKKFKEIMELEFITVEEATFFPYGEHAGASPDGLVGQQAVLEIKCPRVKKFMRISLEGISAVDPYYIDQMQMQMLCTNSEKAYFFNYLIINNKEYSNTIEVWRDEKRIDFIKERLNQAIDLKLNYVEQLKRLLL